MRKKAIYGVVTGAILLAGVGAIIGLTSSNNARADEPATSASSKLTTNNGLTGQLIDETVYVFLGADGHVKKTISSDWTKNDLGADVYTKTEGNVSAPIEVKISYYLDGKKISADELRGRTGHVKIRYDYTNTERINGVYMPYAVISGMLLTNEKFTNISVKNGKLMNDGTRTTIVGLALPGMKENLGVNADIPEYVEVEADVKEFKMEMTATVATSKLFAELDVSALDSVEALSSQLNTLASSMAQLMDGSVKLSEGLSTLSNKSVALIDGVEKLRAGSLKLVSGASELSSGLGTAASGAKDLATGLASASEGGKTLASGVSDAYNGAQQIDAGVSQLSGSITELVNGFATLNADDANTKLISGATQLRDGTIKALKDGGMTTITADNFETVLNGAIEQYAAAGQEAKVKELSTYLAQLRVYDGAAKYIAGVGQIAAGAATAPEKLAPLKAGTTKLSEGLKQMNAKVPELSSGLEKLSNGANSLSDGITKAYNGSSELASGMATLDNGIDNLASNMPALQDGVSQLVNGSKSLSDGLSMFNEQGVQRLISLYNGNVRALVSRIQNIVSTARNADKKVKYIYRTEEI